MNKRHIGAYGIIIEDNKIALIKKSRGAYKGKLDFPGGTIEDDERPVDTLVREIKEEVDGDVSAFKLFDVDSVVVDWKYENTEIHMHHIGLFYKVKLNNNNLKTDSDGLDSLGADWFEIKKLKEDDVAPLVWIEINKIKIEE